MSGVKLKKDATKSTMNTATTKTKTVSAETTQPRRRMVQSYLVIWVDANINPEKDDYKNSLAQLRSVINDVNLCTTTTQCIEYLKQNDKETAFIICSGALGQSIISNIHELPQVAAVYIFCGNKSLHEIWAKQWIKIKGVHTSIKPICEELQLAVKQCNQNDISVSIISVNEASSADHINQLDPSFMYSQIFKEILLDMKHDQKAIKDLIIFCQALYQGNVSELCIIDEFERTYNASSAIWWYTRECFTYNMLNRALRTLDGDVIITMGFFLCDLHRQIENLCQNQISVYNGKTFTVYRGQSLSVADFNLLENNKGGLLSFNSFLSTSRQRNLSLSFAKCASVKQNMVGILFHMSIDPSVSSTPFASIEGISYFKNEDEILFSMHTVFRIGDVTKIDSKLSLYQIELKLTSDDDQQLRLLTDRIRQEASGPTGWTRLGKLLLRIGQFDKAEQLYNTLLEQTSENSITAYIYHQLGWLKDDQGKYKEAASFYEKSLEIYRQSLPPDHPSLATSYNNIGLAYKRMGDYEKALKFYEQDLEITKKALPPTHPSLATSYNNIGQVYNSMGDYKRALEFYEKAHQIFEKALPPNHPDLATSYSNIGSVYDFMKDYSTALQYYQKDLEIKKKALPSNHPLLATSYNNIGLVYKNMGDLPQALHFYEKDFEITKKSLASNHPDLAISYNNLGSVYDDMGEPKKALEFYEKALQIQEKNVPPNHPDLAISCNNIGLVYESLNEYVKARQFYDRALRIAQSSLPANHPHLKLYKDHLQNIKQKS